MKYRVIIVPSAKREIRHALLWQVENRPVNANAWYLGIQKAIYDLREWPLRYALAYENDEFPVELRQLLYSEGRRAYRILYTVRDNKVYVLHVRHASRAPVKPGEIDLPRE